MAAEQNDEDEDIERCALFYDCDCQKEKKNYRKDIILAMYGSQDLSIYFSTAACLSAIIFTSIFLSIRIIEYFVWLSIIN